ncbi:hypothetical protein BKH46_09065 [Helicobacter sp. 12S02634-8]|nr:hypothetical protein BKH46_09065 [Helicobacter sp. 12S02634-8]
MALEVFEDLAVIEAWGVLVLEALSLATPSLENLEVFRVRAFRVRGVLLFVLGVLALAFKDLLLGGGPL